MRHSTDPEAVTCSLNLSYFRSCSGLLKILQLCVSIVCTGIMGYFVSNYADVGEHFYSYFRHELFFLIVSCSALIGSGCLALAMMLSAHTAQQLPHTAFEWLYHLLMAALYFASSVGVLAVVSERDSRQQLRDLEAKVTAAVLGLFNCLIYTGSFAVAVRSHSKH